MSKITKTELEAIKEYYEDLKKKIVSEDDAILMTVASSVLFSIAATKAIDEDDIRRINLSTVLEKIGGFIELLEYDDLEIHKKVMTMMDMVFMDLKAINGKLEIGEMN